MSAENAPPNEWYIQPPARLTIALSALLGLWGGALTAVAIGAHRAAMAVVLVLTTVALLVLVARRGQPAGGVRGRWTDIASARPAWKKRGAKAPQPLSTAEEIAKLGQLLEAGLITEAEFAAQKAKLLDS